MIRNLDLFRNTVSFANLGSGSRGNATVVVCNDSAILVDCGLSCRQVRLRLRKLGITPSRVKGIVLTHDHGDHVAGTRVTARTFEVPVYMSEGCMRKVQRGRLALDEGTEIRTFEPGDKLKIGALEVESFRVPHDTVDPVGFAVGVGGDRVGIATDMGSPSRRAMEVLGTCRAVLLEFNHDTDMLRGCDYPTSVKDRVGGRWGHLSNRQAADIVKSLRRSRVEEVLLGHLSESSNTPELALEAARAGVGHRARKRIALRLASQDAPSTLISLTERRIGRRNKR